MKNLPLYLIYLLPLYLIPPLTDFDNGFDFPLSGIVFIGSVVVFLIIAYLVWAIFILVCQVGEKKIDKKIEQFDLQGIYGWRRKLCSKGLLLFIWMLLYWAPLKPALSPVFDAIFYFEL